jgi:hypothetical protein
MAYSCSSHFSDQFSYITLCISNYGLQDMNFTRFKHFLQNKEERKGRGRTGPNLRCPGPDLACCWRWIEGWRRGESWALAHPWI